MSRPANDPRHRPDDQKAPNVRLPRLRYPPQPRLAACGMLARDEPEPGREIPAALELHRSHVLNIKGRSYRLRNLEDALKG